MRQADNNNDWKLLYYHFIPNDLHDPKVQEHLPENGKCYEIELYTYTDTGNLVFKKTCIARYEECIKPEVVGGLTLLNKSKWIDKQEKEITDIVLRFREI